MSEENQINEHPETEEGFSDFLSGLFNNGAQAVHEGHVHGSVLEQTRRMVEDYIKPDLGELSGPDDLRVPVQISNSRGVSVIPPEDFDAWRDRPRHRTGTATMTDLPSFVGHVNRYKDDHTVIFARDDRSSPGLTAVLDYHEIGADGLPRFGRHRTAFNFPLDDTWKAWLALNNQKMDMADFARFIEDHYIEIIPADIVASSFSGEDDPVKKFVDSLGGVSKLGDPRDLMQIAGGLSVHESSVIGEATRLSSGEGKLVFQVDHETRDAAGAQIIVPAAFGIAIPVFRGEPPYCLLARLRYRKHGPKLTLWYELFRHDLTFDHAVNEAIEKVQGETGVTVWKGSPE